MRGGFEETLVLELAMDADQGLADLPLQGDAHRLVVEISARPPVGAKHSAQEQRLFVVAKPLFSDDMVCRMVVCDFELGHHHRLIGAMADQGTIGPRAERQAKSVEQD